MSQVSVAGHLGSGSRDNDTDEYQADDRRGRLETPLAWILSKRSGARCGFECPIALIGIVMCMATVDCTWGAVEVEQALPDPLPVSEYGIFNYRTE